MITSPFACLVLGGIVIGGLAARSTQTEIQQQADSGADDSSREKQPSPAMKRKLPLMVLSAVLVIVLVCWALDQIGAMIGRGFS